MVSKMEIEREREREGKQRSVEVMESLGTSNDSEEKTLYMFFWHSEGPVTHTLYVVDIPIIDSEPLVRPPPNTPQESIFEAEVENLSQISRVLTFKRTEFPDRMRCVELGSKLYLLGGRVGEFVGQDEREAFLQEHSLAGCVTFPYSPNMFVFDLATANAISRNDVNASEMLIEGIPMESGKPNCVAFAAKGKIYALGGREIIDEENETQLNNTIVYFEVFDPDSNSWSTLPDPPCNDGYLLLGQAVVRNQVHVLTRTNHWEFYVLCFNLDKNEWETTPVVCNNFSYKNCSFHFAFVDDMLYGTWEEMVAVYGPFKKDNDQGNDEPFNRIAVLEPRGMDFYHYYLPTHWPCISLVHLQNSRFCRILTGNALEMEYIPQTETNYGEQTKVKANIKVNDFKRHFSITIFDSILGEEDLPAAKHLHSGYYFSTSGWLDQAHIQDLFLIPKIRFDSSVQLDGDSCSFTAGLKQG